MLDALLSPKERQKLVEEIGQYVIDHINVTVDVSDAISQIEELNKAIDNLGRK